PDQGHPTDPTPHPHILPCAASGAHLRRPSIPDARPRGAPAGSVTERRERVFAPDQLLGLRPDHLATTFELAVEKQAADVDGPLEEADDRPAAGTRGHVPPSTDEAPPPRPDRRFAGPHEQRPAPVPSSAEILGRRAAGGRPPEQQHVVRPLER